MKDTDVATLRECLGKYRVVKITRALASPSEDDGFILGLSKSLVLVFVFHDFHPDGCRVYRTSDITKTRSSVHERMFDRMYAAEGLLDAVGVSRAPPLDDMATLLTHLCDSDQPAVVEAEALKGASDEDDLFLIGYIESVKDGLCWVRTFDTLGVWEDEPTGVDVDDVTAVQLDAPYLETFLRHIPPRPKGDN